MLSSTLSFAEEYDLAVTDNRGLGQLFHDKAIESPEAIAIVDGETYCTYAQLHDKASALAQKLFQQGFRHEEPVGIITQHGFADIVAQLGIIYAGGSCVPVDPEFPDQQIRRRLNRLDVRFVLTDRINQFRTTSYCGILVDNDCTRAVTAVTDFQPAFTTLDHCGHLIHTSGTTGDPKVVQIAARSILHVAYHAPFEPVRKDDVVAHVNNSSFDVSLFDIWTPLLRGGRIAVIGKTVLLDLPLLAREIDRLGITIIATTTAILNLAAFSFPQVFEKLRVCFFGGEAANIAAIKRIFEAGCPELLVNAYGPTECCIFCLTRQVTRKDVEIGRISIGKPIGRNVAYIVDGEEQPSEQGELWIGGPGVSPGYVNHSEKNITSFHTLASSSTAGTDPIRVYKTGDIVRRRSDGQIDYVGRQDHQVKIRGFRVELGAVEKCLLNTRLVTEAVAMKVEIPQRGAGSLLVAYAVPVDSTCPPIANDVLELVRKSLPPYMVPQLELIPLMPLNSHAKVDRKLLTDLFNRRWEVCGPQALGEIRNIRGILSDIWSKLLTSSTLIYKDDDDFIKLGGTSIQAALLISQIRQTFNIEISLLTFYNNTTIRALTTIVAERLAGRLEMLQDDRDLWIADSQLGDSLALPPGPTVDWKSESEGRIFFTGATGFVGSFLLASLLRTQYAREVTCLVRAGDAATGLQRLRVTMRKYGVWEESFTSKIQILPGCLEDEYLGLGPRKFGDVALTSSVIFHLGAHVNYAQPYSMHRPANTLGTHNIVRLACAGRLKPVHYVSSISCFGPTGFITEAKLVRETDPLVPHLAALPFDHGYAQSQWVADEMLRRLATRGFPIIIYRPGFVTGHSQTGACNADDFFSRLVDACCEMGCYPRLPNQRKEFVPVDYVCDAISHIATSSTSHGRAYHIVPPTRAASIDMDDTINLAAKIAGKEIRAVSYAEWAKRLGSVSPKRLLPLQPMLMEKVLEGRTRWELYENMPVYDTTNTTEALADYPGGLKFPVLDGSLMRRYMEYLKLCDETSKASHI